MCRVSYPRSPRNQPPTATASASSTNVLPAPFTPTRRFICGWNENSRCSKPLKFSTVKQSMRMAFHPSTRSRAVARKGVWNPVVLSDAEASCSIRLILPSPERRSHSAYELLQVDGLSLSRGLRICCSTEERRPLFNGVDTATLFKGPLCNVRTTEP